MPVLKNYEVTLSRKEALEQGATRYKGQMCPKWHTGIRYTGSGNCIECIRLKYIPTGNKKGKVKDPIRQAAREKGEIYYFTGRPCKAGHLTKRRTVSGSCMECHKLRPKPQGRDYTLRTKYGITLEQYNKMFEKQKGVCFLCGKEEFRIDPQTDKIKQLSVDHCHTTKKIRGLLCCNCNMGIGLLSHNPELLRKTALYCE